MKTTHDDRSPQPTRRAPSQSRGRPTQPPDNDAPSEDLIDEAIEESFPASDPPAWPAGRERGR